MSDETLLAVVDDEGVSTWLEDTLTDVGRLEKVTSGDLGRVIRMLEAAGASIALVEINQAEPSASMAVITAISSARPWVTVVAVSRYPQQDQILDCMRAGARDCITVGTEGTELRDRLRRHLLVRPRSAGQKLESANRNLIMVAGVNPRVDTAFLAQNLASALAASGGKRILAIDVSGEHDGAFHLDNPSTLDLGQLLASPDTLDDTLINTALPEVRPGLRLLAGGKDNDFLGDRGADLFIALSRLMGMFDCILMHVGSASQSSWIRSIGVHVRELIVVAHQDVSQLHAAREDIADWRPHLSEGCPLRLVIDGFESGLPPNVDDIVESTDCEVAVTLPMDWKHRLEAINLGQAMDMAVTKSPYNKKLAQLVKIIVQQSHLTGSKGNAKGIKAAGFASFLKRGA